MTHLADHITSAFERGQYGPVAADIISRCMGLPPLVAVTLRDLQDGRRECILVWGERTRGSQFRLAIIHLLEPSTPERLWLELYLVEPLLGSSTLVTEWEWLGPVTGLAATSLVSSIGGTVAAHVGTVAAAA